MFGVGVVDVVGVELIGVTGLTGVGVMFVVVVFVGVDVGGRVTVGCLCRCGRCRCGQCRCVGFCVIRGNVMGCDQCVSVASVGVIGVGVICVMDVSVHNNWSVNPQLTSSATHLCMCSQQLHVTPFLFCVIMCVLVFPWHVSLPNLPLCSFPNSSMLSHTFFKAGICNS